MAENRSRARAGRRRDTLPVNLPLPGPRWWQWLGPNGQAAAVVISIILALLSAGASIAWVTWHLSKYDSRLAAIEGVINGSGGSSLGDRLVRIEQQLNDIDKYILPQIYGSKAKSVLGVPDVEVFRVVHNKVTTDSKFSTVYKDPVGVPSPQRDLFVNYSVEGIKGGGLIMRTWVEEEEGGKVVRIFEDRHVRIPLPSEVGKSEEYCFKVGDDKDVVQPVPFCIEIVLLERHGPDNLVFASAVKTQTSS